MIGTILVFAGGVLAAWHGPWSVRRMSRTTSAEFTAIFRRELRRELSLLAMHGGRQTTLTLPEGMTEHEVLFRQLFPGEEYVAPDSKGEKSDDR